MGKTPSLLAFSAQSQHLFFWIAHTSPASSSSAHPGRQGVCYSVISDRMSHRVMTGLILSVSPSVVESNVTHEAITGVDDDVS